MKLYSEDRVTFNGNTKYKCIRFVSARTTLEIQCETIHLYSSVGVGQQSTMISKPILIPRGYVVLLSTCKVFHHRYQKGLTIEVHVMKIYFGEFQIGEMKR